MFNFDYNDFQFSFQAQLDNLYGRIGLVCRFLENHCQSFVAPSTCCHESISCILLFRKSLTFLLYTYNATAE
jgi:hypothetical protein